MSEFDVAGKIAPQRWPENATLKEYSGSCHCKKFQYKLEHPVFEDGTVAVTDCNCSLCANKGLLLIYTTEDHYRFTSGSWEEATVYRFNQGIVSHYFCPVCGVQFGGTGMDLVAVNVRSLEGIEIDTLKVKQFDGKNLL